MVENTLQALKDLQPLIAVIFASGTPFLAFYGVRSAAKTAFLSAQAAAGVAAVAAQKVKDTEISWNQAQAEQALRFKRTAFVTWLWLRCVESRETLLKCGERLAVLNSVKEREQTDDNPDVDRTPHQIRESIVSELNELSSIFETSGLGAATLDFLMQIHQDDQRLYAAAVFTLKRADSSIENCQRAFRRTVTRPSLEGTSIDTLARELSALMTRIEQMRLLEEKLLARMRELGAI